MCRRRLGYSPIRRAEGAVEYETWIIKRWETPFSAIGSIALASLVDDGQLTITFEAPREPGRPRWKVKFDKIAGYRNLLEEFRLELWQHLDTTQQRCGNTFTVANSPWIKELRRREGVFEAIHPNSSHFVFLTEDDVIEVLSSNSPAIEFLGATPEGSKPAGKTTVY